MRMLSEDALEDEEYSHTIEEFVDIYEFANWKHRNRCINTSDMKARLGIGSLFSVFCSPNQYLIYLEYIGNMIFLCNHSSIKNSKYNQFDYILESYEFIIEQLNYELIELSTHQGVFLCEKNPDATAAAEISDPNLALSILRYNHHSLKGDIDAKKRILLELGHDLEGYSKELRASQSALDKEAGFLLNSLNIRHNNCTPPDEGGNKSYYIPYVSNMSAEELENWYDETYQVLLLCKLEHDHLARKNRIKELNKFCEDSKAVSR